MDSVKQTQLRMLKSGLLLNGFICIIALVFLKNPINFVVGIVFGMAISLLNFRLLYLTLNRAVQMPPPKAQAYATSRYLLRYVITGIVVYVSIQADYINVLGTIAGLTSLKLVILKTELFNSKEYFKNILKRKEER
ncbi:ATP synthase subunit I [Alkaliphilus peptidifermentans]|uniref:ATP synthase I chain n=1 Tax=Alkaliphilus peptidifermentans DSM 18978 TaxID=1120976 RepID=A0A1G5JHA0_9FIRM|nr:ATP synthase subunit I [Alkaliphilus peptidifermentans]SCY87534.1 ATP synthase I chain [Alkaliphilus peptidifermentans DSM 18978]